MPIPRLPQHPPSPPFSFRRLLTALCCLLLPLVAACGSSGYQPVSERSFQAVSADGCGKEGNRVTTTAKINRVYEDTLVLWDGADASTVVSMRLSEPDLGQRARGVMTKTRFERAYEELKGLEERGWPVTVTATCREGDVPPVVTRFSYRNADNQRREIELAN